MTNQGKDEPFVPLSPRSSQMQWAFGEHGNWGRQGRLGGAVDDQDGEIV